MPNVYESVRQYLLDLGPHHPAFRAAIHAQARINGFRLTSTDAALSLSRSNRTMLLPSNHYPQVPTAIHMWDLYFATMATAQRGGKEILDFSTPGLRTYKRTGVSLWAPGMAEDDTMDVYTAQYKPKPGDTVWDVGAHAGATVYFFSHMVGSSGRVFAFEPDEAAYEYLLRNIELHRLDNVTPVRMAMAGETATLLFSMDGTQGAGIKGFTQCADKSQMREVQAISFEDACKKYGIPDYVKMDIEGAEAEVAVKSIDFLRQHAIHFAIESDHRVDGEFTTVALCRIFADSGYSTKSSTEYGMQFTWADPQ